MLSELSNDSNLGNDIDYLVVGGGGGAGAYHSSNGTGGAGAGGLRSNMPSVPSQPTPAYNTFSDGTIYSSSRCWWWLRQRRS